MPARPAGCKPLLLENFFQRCDAFSILLHRSHRDANPFGQFVTFERSHDNVRRQQLFEDSGPVADIYHHKIRDARRKLDLHLGKLLLQISTTFIDNAFRLALMRVILESGECTGVSNAVDVKWLPRLLEHFDQVPPRDAVPDAQAGKSVNFRKSAQNDYVPAVANVFERLGRIIEELKIGFVENNDDVFRNSRHETVDPALRKQPAGWRVG